MMLIGFTPAMSRIGAIMAGDDLDFDAPRQHTAKIPIFCQQCRRQGRAVYLKGDDPRIIRESGSGYYRGPTMRLTAYLAGAPRVCQSCDKQLLAATDVFSEQE